MLILRKMVRLYQFAMRMLTLKLICCCGGGHPWCVENPWEFLWPVVVVVELVRYLSPFVVE
jgi:hypothetical protein